MSFYEPNDYPADHGQFASSQSLSRPVAVGGHVSIGVLTEQPNEGQIGLCTIESVSSDNPQALSLDGVGTVHRFFAGAVGTARLTFTAKCPPPNTHVTDSIVMRTAEADEAKVAIMHASILPTALSMFMDKGVALRPGAKLRVGSVPKRNGKSLLGFNIFEWDADDELLEYQKKPEDSGVTAGAVNTCWVTGRGVSGLTTLGTQFGGGLPLATLSSGDIPTLKLYGFDFVSRSEGEVDLITGQDVLYRLAGFDDAGRFVHAAKGDDDTFSLTVTEGSVEGLKFSHANSDFEITAGKGSGTFTVTYLGAQFLVPFDIDIAAP